MLGVGGGHRRGEGEWEGLSGPVEAGTSSTCSMGSGDTLQESGGHPTHIRTPQGRKTLSLAMKGRQGRQREAVSTTAS